MTGDDHASGGTAGALQPVPRRQPGRAARSRSGSASAAARTCIPNSPLTERAGGGLHGAGLRGRPAREHRLRGLHAGVARGRLHGPADRVERARTRACPRPTTQRTHCIVWSDWVGTPRVELAHGMRLDGNYYYWPPGWVLDVPGMFTGSGMPMRFADTDGSHDRRLPVDYPDDRRVGPVVPVHDQHAARPRARGDGLLRRLQREHAHRRGQLGGRGRDRGVGQGARRAGRVRRSRC